MPERSQFMGVPAGVQLPSVVNAIVEIPSGRRSKFELDKETGLMKLDRYLYSSSHYPGACATAFKQCVCRSPCEAALLKSSGTPSVPPAAATGTVRSNSAQPPARSER
jgi:hypothetical protein